MTTDPMTNPEPFVQGTCAAVPCAGDQTQEVHATMPLIGAVTIKFCDTHYALLVPNITI